MDLEGEIKGSGGIPKRVGNMGGPFDEEKRSRTSTLSW